MSELPFDCASLGLPSQPSGLMAALLPVPTRSDMNPETQDLAFGRKAAIILLGVNALLIAVFLLGPAGLVWARAGAIWIMTLEGVFFMLIFLPVFAYRLIRKRERVRLAASRALQSFVEALGLAPG